MPSPREQAKWEDWAAGHRVHANSRSGRHSRRKTTNTRTLGNREPGLIIHRYDYVTAAGATPPLPPQPPDRWRASVETLEDGRVRYTWEYVPKEDD